jgi:aspartyl-tRNA(Asn)/glutamyl-tRNA(Gln) amidotransferase subunit B
MSLDSDYEMVIGLEVHAQMLTQAKIFCGCSTRFGAEANTQICPVCAGYPGVLPVLNREVVTLTVKTGLAIEGTINPVSEFARKNYFYPDLPAGYQISQFDRPIISAGALQIDRPDGQTKRIGITRIHIEVDAGKNLHEGIAGASWVDLNRTGVPLMEIVSEPDLRSAEEAGEYLKKLRATLRYLEVCDGNMEEGSFRCDANVSVRRRGTTAFGTRCELKNLNSIRNVMRAIDFEAERHVDLIESGGAVVQETRLWDAQRNETRSMRGKEEAHDYRYFPEPDLPPLTVSTEWVDTIRATLPELPDQKRHRFITTLDLSPYDAGVLTSSRELADYFETVAQELADGGQPDPKLAANWVTVELLGLLNKENRDITDSPVTAVGLGQLLRLIKDNTLSGKIAKTVFATMYEKAHNDPQAIVAERGLKQVTDQGAIEKAVEQVLAKHTKEVKQYQEGKTKLLGFFVGQVMQATRGKANPAMVNTILKEKLQ